MRLLRFFFKKLPTYIFALFVINAIMGALVRLVFGTPKFNVTANDLLQFKSLLLIELPLGALIEELIFRLIPFTLLFLPKYLFSDRQIFITMVVSSAIFGYSHGDVRGILIQGVIGLYLSWIFWRYSFRIKNTEGLFVGLLASTIVHLSYNSFVILCVYLVNFSH